MGLLILAAATTVSALVIGKHEASQLLRAGRVRRGNSGSLKRAEEFVKRSNLKRECADEDCSKEEHDEIFENFVKGYRKLEVYSKDLYGCYTKCKPFGERIDEEELGECIKERYAL